MGAVDLGGSKPSGGGEGKAWKRPRVAIKIDMTPMVDIAFLLLIFFMVTTVFRLPTAMEMILPPPDEPAVESKVNEKSMLSFMVLENDSLALQIGVEAPVPLHWDSLKPLLDSKYEEFEDKVIVVTKIHPDAKYETMVNLIDEFNLANTTKFSVDRYTTYEDSLLRLNGFETSGPEGLPDPKYTFEVEEGEL